MGLPSRFSTCPEVCLNVTGCPAVRKYIHVHGSIVHSIRHARQYSLPPFLNTVGKNTFQPDPCRSPQPLTAEKVAPALTERTTIHNVIHEKKCRSRDLGLFRYHQQKILKRREPKRHKVIKGKEELFLVLFVVQGFYAFCDTYLRGCRKRHKIL